MCWSITGRVDAVQAAISSGALRGEALTAFEMIIRRGLRARTPPGGVLYHLDWQHPCYQFDSRWVGIPGMPPWPGTAHPTEDYHLY